MSRRTEYLSRVNDSLWESNKKANEQYYRDIQAHAARERKLTLALELLANLVGIRENYLVENDYDTNRLDFDGELLVEDLLAEQEKGEVLMSEDARKARLAAPQTTKKESK